MKTINRVLPFAAVLALIGQAHAAAPTSLAELASSVSFADVGGAILAVSGVAITMYVLWKGAKFVIKAVKGA